MKKNIRDEQTQKMTKEKKTLKKKTPEFLWAY